MLSRVFHASLTGRASLRGRLFWASGALWLGSFTVPAVMWWSGSIQAIPFHEYLHAGERWARHEPLYDLSNIDGFQYFPQAAFLFSALTWIPEPSSAIVWLALGWFALASGLYRLLVRLGPAAHGWTFALASACAIGPAITNLFNGQANLLLAALVVHTVVALLDRRLWLASVLLALGTALKPLMLIPLLLFAATSPALLPRLALTLAIAACAPFATRDAHYVLAQGRDCLVKLQLCANPDRLFEDLRGLLATAGFQISAGQYTIIRAAAALLVLVAAWHIHRKEREPRRMLLIGSLACGYLVLFNPRTLSSGYVMPGAFVAVWAALAIEERKLRDAAFFTAIVIAWSINRHVVPWVEFWLRPLAAGAFLLWLAVAAWRAPQAGSVRTEPVGSALRGSDADVHARAPDPSRGQAAS